MNSNHRDDSESAIPGQGEEPSPGEVREARLTAYAIGELSPDERAGVEAELAASPMARQAVDDLRALAEQIRSAARTTGVLPSSELRAAVESRLRRPPVQWTSSRAESLDAPSLSATRARRTRLAWAAMAVAACVMSAAVGLYVGRGNRGSDAGSNELTRRIDEAPRGVAGQAALADANRPAAGWPLSDGEVNDGGWRRHNAVPGRSVVAQGQSTAATSPPRLAVADTVPVPAKVDSGSTPAIAPPPKADTFAGSPWTLPRVPSRGTRHQAAASPGFYATVPPELPVPAPPKKPREAKDAGAGGPKPFGSGAGGPQPPPSGSGAAAADGKGDASKHPSAGEANLALPAGMRPGREKPPGASKPGKDVKANKKAKGLAAAPPEPDVPDEPLPEVMVENEFLPAAGFPYSAFSLEVDRNVYGVVDRHLRAGHLPWSDRIQVEHLVNYFQYDDPQPAGEATFAIGVEGAACPWAPDHRLVRIAIVGRGATAPETRRGNSGRAAAATIANDVCVQLQFFPALVESYRLIGYDGPPMAGQKLDGGLPKGVDFAAGETITALYELVPAKPAKPVPADARPTKTQRSPVRDPTAVDRTDLSLIVRLRYQRPRSEEYGLAQVAWTDAGRSFDSASNDFRFAAAVAAFGMVLRGSPSLCDVTLETVARMAESARGEDPFGQRAEFVDLVRVARQLKTDR